MTPETDTPSILLASNSPRRREMLGWLGWPFRAQGMDIDETAHTGEVPGAYCLRLAEDKGQAALALARPGEIILAADTIVADGNDLLGKPADAAEAESILRRLRGGMHTVYTALSLIDPHSGRMVSDLCAAVVQMRQYRDEEMLAYIASGDPFDKAGAYAIQHPNFDPVENFADCYACVMGLPVCNLLRALRALGYAPSGNVPAICQAQLSYHCPMFEKILSTPPTQPVGQVSEGYST